MMRHRRIAACRGDRGFALMEVLIAFTIAAMAIATLAYGVTTAFRSDLRAQSSRAEMRLAQSRLEAAGIEQPLVAGTIEGDTNGLHWRQHVSKAKPIVLAAPLTAKDGKRSTAELYWVEIVVKGRDGRELRVATSKVGFAMP